MKRKNMITVLLALFMIMQCIRSPTSVQAGVKDTYISKTAYDACMKYGKEYGICPELIMSIIETESHGDPKAKNGSCKGLMQVSERWHKDRMKKLGVKNLYDECGNIHVGTDYLAELFDKYGDAATVLMVYHGERNAVSKSKSGKISYYAKTILDRSAQLEKIHKK